MAQLRSLVEHHLALGGDCLEIVAPGDSFSNASLPYFVGFTWPYGPYDLDLTGSRITDEGLAVLRGSKITSLTLDDTAIGDTGLVHLPDSVRFLSLKRTRVTDAGLQQLERLDLWHIELDGCSITDEGLKWIPSLSRLSLADTEVRGPGLGTLKTGECYLKELDLSGTKITDETIEYLAGLDYSCCNLNRTAITDAGLRRLLRHEKTPFSFRLNNTSISPELDAAIQTKLDKYERCIDTFDLRQLLDSRRSVPDP